MLGKTFKIFQENNNGAVAVIFAIVLIPLLLCVGALIDYSFFFQSRTASQDALDSGVMAAAVHYRQHQNVKKSRKESKRIFESNCMTTGCNRTRIARAPNIKVSSSGSNKVTGSFTTAYETVTMKIIGIRELKFSVEAEVNLTPVFQEYHFAIDRRCFH